MTEVTSSLEAKAASGESGRKATASLPVLTTSELKAELPNALKRFRRDGISAQPIIFGARRKPEAALIPFALYTELRPATGAALARSLRADPGSVDPRPIKEATDD